MPLNQRPRLDRGNSLFVDPVHGTAGGLRGDAMRPFATIHQAVAAAQAGDTIFGSPGTYGPYDQGIVFPDDVSMVMPGSNAAVIQFETTDDEFQYDVPTWIDHNLISPGRRGLYRGFKMTWAKATPDSSTYAFPLGLADGSIFEDVWCVNPTDGIFSWPPDEGVVLVGGIPLFGRTQFIRCRIDTRWDACVVKDVAAGTIVDLIDCTFTAANVLTSPTLIRTSGGGVINVYGGSFTATAANAAIVRAEDLGNTGSRASTINLFGPALLSGTPGYDVNCDSLCTVNLYAGTRFDPTKVTGAGTLNTPGAAFVRTVTANPQHATAGSRPNGLLGEIVRYNTDSKLYHCTNGTTPTWEKLTST